jgi:hypothetical protein
MGEPIVVALIGVAGAVVGSVATIAGSVALHCLRERATAKRNKPAKELLLAMLTDTEYEWRRLDTLMHVIGADEKTTKRLLLEIGGRASEDGAPLWGLKERHPLPRAHQ